RVRPAFQQAPAVPAAAPQSEAATLATARTVFAGLAKPAFLCDESGALVYANAPYLELAATLALTGTDRRPPEVLSPEEAAQLRRVLAADGKPRTSTVTLGAAGPFDLNEFPVAGGSAGYLQPRVDRAAVALDAGLSHLSGIIDALATPIAIFNARRELVQSNSAYATL